MNESGNVYTRALRLIFYVLVFLRCSFETVMLLITCAQLADLITTIQILSLSTPETPTNWSNVVTLSVLN